MIDESIQVTLSGHSYITRDSHRVNNNKKNPEKTKVQYYKCNKSPGKKAKPQSTQTDNIDSSSEDEHNITDGREYNTSQNRLNHHPKIINTSPRYPKKKSEFYTIPFFDSPSRSNNSKPPLIKKTNMQSSVNSSPIKKQQNINNSLYNTPKQNNFTPKPSSLNDNEEINKMNTTPNISPLKSSLSNTPNNNDDDNKLNTPISVSFKNLNSNHRNKMGQNTSREEGQRTINLQSGNNKYRIELNSSEPLINIKYSPVSKNNMKNKINSISLTYSPNRTNNNSNNNNNNDNNNRTDDQDDNYSNYSSSSSDNNENNNLKSNGPQSRKSPLNSINNLDNVNKDELQSNNSQFKNNNKNNNEDQINDTSINVNNNDNNINNNNINNNNINNNNINNKNIDNNNIDNNNNSNNSNNIDNDNNVNDNRYILAEGSSVYSSEIDINSQNNSNNKMKDSPRQKIKDKIRNHLFNSKFDKSLYDGNYPIIINTFSETESDTNTNNTFSSNLSNSHNDYLSSRTSHSYRSLSSPHSHSIKKQSRYKNIKNNNINNNDNNMTMPSPDISEKIKKNHLALNTENINLSQKPYRDKKMYDYINNKNNDDIENKSISSSRYTSNTGYYTYSTSSYYMSDVDYSNGSGYFEEMPKLSNHMQSLKQEKYKNSINNPNLNQFLIYDNNNEQPKINTNINNIDGTASISSSSVSHRHHHRHHHHRRRHHNRNTSDSNTNNSNVERINNKKDYYLTHSMVKDNENIRRNEANLDDSYYRMKKLQNYLNSQNLKNKENGKKENYNIKEILPNDTYLSDLYYSTYTDIESEFDKLSLNNEIIKKISNNNNNKNKNDNNDKLVNDQENMTSPYGSIKTVSTNNNISNNNTIKSTSNYQETLKSSNEKGK